MSINEFRRLAAKIDQHMQQLAAQGVGETHAIINRMMGYVPDPVRGKPRRPRRGRIARAAQASYDSYVESAAP